MTNRFKLKKNYFDPDPKKILNTYTETKSNVQKVMSNSDIQEIAAGIYNSESPFFNSYTKSFKESIDKFYSESFIKSVEMTRLDSTNRKFTLTPLIAEYTEEGKEAHHLAKLVEKNSEIDHIFVDPKHAVEGVFYHYVLYIPIPEDLYDMDDKYDLVTEHWTIILNSLYKYRNLKYISQLKPKYLTGRVYGWDGSWIAYEVTIQDNNDFWSLPMVDSYYNGVQPFIAVPNGEFVVLENDETKRSQDSIRDILIRIHSRAENCGNILLKQNECIEIIQDENQKSNYTNINEMVDELLEDIVPIEISPELAVAHSILKNHKKKLKDFGSTLPSACMEDPEKIASIQSTDELLEFMQEELMKPAYMFSPSETKKCILPKKI